MNRRLLGITTLVVAAFLAGCPIYSDNGNYRVCDSQGCYDCPDNVHSGACVPWPCNTNDDCGDGTVCGNGICVGSSGTSGYSGYSGSSGYSGVTGYSGATGATGATGASGSVGFVGSACTAQSQCPNGAVCAHDGTCHLGDCGGNVGCVGTLVCKVEDGRAVCVAPSPPLDAAAPDATAPDATAPDGSTNDATASGDSSSEASARASDAAGDATGTADVADGASLDALAADTSIAPGAPCNADSQCGDAGVDAKCIDGQCTAQAQLCSDGTQCVVSGDLCVDGICTPPCSASVPCAAGFGCDFARHACAENPRVCAGDADCQGGTVCVESHCAAPCAADAGTACPAGQLCINGGCIPDQRATFACFNDGEQGTLANRCGAADICLHGDCYPACDVTSDANSCTGNTACKQVMVTKGTFAVCGTAANLGSACDVAAGRFCASGTECVDGYCL